MSDGDSGSKPRGNSPAVSADDLSNEQILAALGGSFLAGTWGSTKWQPLSGIDLNLTGSWRARGQSRAEGLVTGATWKRLAVDQRSHPWTPGLHMEVRARGALVSRDRELHRIVGHGGYANQVYGNRQVKSGFEHSVCSKDRTVVVQGMEGLGSDILPDVRFGRDTLDVAEDAVLKWRARTTLMSGTLTRRYLGGFIKAAPMEGVICGGSLVRTIGGPSANLSALCSGDVYGGAARVALARTRIGLLHYRAAVGAAWSSIFYGRAADFVIEPLVSVRQTGPQSNVARKLGRLAKVLNVVRMVCPLVDIASGVIGLVGGLGYGLFKLIRNKVKGKPPPPATETMPRLRTPLHSVALEKFGQKIYL